LFRERSNSVKRVRFTNDDGISPGMPHPVSRRVDSDCSLPMAAGSSPIWNPLLLRSKKLSDARPPIEAGIPPDPLVPLMSRVFRCFRLPIEVGI